jgi:phosphatidylglycerol:prolipoprotein diacylglycerol transferase
MIGVWLWMRGGKPRPTGWILGEYLILSGTARFMVEFIRRNPKILWGLSNAQLASAGSVLVGIAIVIWSATRRPVHSDEPALAVEKTA